MHVGDWRVVSDEDPIARWARLAVAEAAIDRFGFASHHLDDLGIAGELTSLDGAIDIVVRATAAVRCHSDAAVRLAVPAPCVEAMSTVLPSLIPWSLGEPEPPSLYLLEDRHLAMPTDREGYRCPYELPQLRAAGVAAEFDCSRRLEDRGWDPPEWTQTVWFFTTSSARWS